MFLPRNDHAYALHSAVRVRQSCPLSDTSNDNDATTYSVNDPGKATVHRVVVPDYPNFVTARTASPVFCCSLSVTTGTGTVVIE